MDEFTGFYGFSKHLEVQSLLWISLQPLLSSALWRPLTKSNMSALVYKGALQTCIAPSTQLLYLVEFNSESLMVKGLKSGRILWKEKNKKPLEVYLSRNHIQVIQ